MNTMKNMVDKQGAVEMIATAHVLQVRVPGRIAMIVQHYTID
jgi:hypothetical protein